MKTPLRLLFIEDSEDDCRIILHELRRCGYEPDFERVQTEADLAAALTRHEWDIIISDYRMPGFSGPAALQLVRQRGLDIPFILVSGTIGEEQAVQSLKAGADDYLLKDRLGRLGAAVANELENRRLRRERSLAQQQLLLQTTALETAANAVIITDPQGTILWVNQAFTTLTGYSRAEAVGQNPRLLKSGKHGPAFYKHLWDTLLAGQTWRGSFINRRKDGSLYLDEHTITPVRADDGAITHFITIMNDVTARRQAEAALRASEGRYRTLVEYAPDGIVVSDTEGRYLDANASMCRMLGYTRDELVGMHATDIVAPEEIPNIASALDMLKARSDHQQEWQFRRKDGSVFPAEVIATMTPDGHLLGMVRDITARKQAEQRIEHLNRVYAVLSDINQTIVREKDPRAMLEAACRIAVEKGKFRMAWIGLAEAATGRLQVTAHAGATPDTLDILRTLLDAEPTLDRCSFTLHALRTGEHGICNDIEHDPRTAPWREAALQRDYRAMAALPLKQGDRIVGTFNLYADVPGVFNAEELLLLDELAMDIGFALEVSQRELSRQQSEAELRWKTAFLEAQVDSSFDGLLVVDDQGRKLLQNARFNELWKIPRQIILDQDDATQVRFATSQTKNPQQFAERVAHLYAHRDEQSRDEIELIDGTVLDRYSAPVRGRDGSYYGRIWSFRDITERKRSEEALRESENHFRVLYENSPYCIHEIDREGRLMMMNRAGLAMMGVQEERAICGTPYLSAVTKEDKDRIGQLLQLAFQGQPCEFEFKASNGLILRSSFVPIRDSQGVVVRLMGLTQDITERRLAAQRIADALNFNQTILAASPVGIITYTAEGSAVSANAAAALLVGTTPQQLLAQNFRQIESWKRTGLTGAAERALATGQEQVLEPRFVTTFGKEVWLAWRFVPFQYAGTPHLLAMFSDVAERKRSEEALRESQQLLEKAQQVGHIGSWVSDPGPDGKVVWSAETCRIFGFEPGEFDGTVKSFHELVHPDDRDTVAGAARAAFAGTSAYNLEHRIVRRDGQVRWVHQQADVERDAEGRPVHLVGVVQDITERAKATDVLQRRAAELERFHRLSVGRELQMIELKKQVNELARLAGKPPPYDLSFQEAIAKPPKQPPTP